MSTNSSNLMKSPMATATANTVAMPQPTHLHVSSHSHSTAPTMKKLQPPQQQQHPITTTKMGSRRIFSAQFKLQVLDSYRMDSDCKGNQRATARKYGIHRRQIQKWLQCESNLRSSVVLNSNNNNNNNSDLQNNQNNNNKMSAMVQSMNGTTTTGVSNNGTTGDNLLLSGAAANGKQQPRMNNSNNNGDSTRTTNKSILNQSATSGNQMNFTFTKNHHHHLNATVHNANDINAMSLDITRHSVAANARALHHNNNNNNNNHHHRENGKQSSYAECYTAAGSGYKCATNADLLNAQSAAQSSTSSSNTSFSVSNISISSALAPTSTENASAPFVARPVPHSSNVAPVSFATPQRQPLRIVSPSFLMSPPESAQSSADALKQYHYAHSQLPAFDYHHPMMYDVQSPIPMIPPLRHYLNAAHELPVALPAVPFPSRPIPHSFENAFHVPNGFYEVPPAAYELYGTPSFVPKILPTVAVPESTPRPETSTPSVTIKSEPSEQSPIDLTVDRQSPIKSEPTTRSKPRFSLPSPPIKTAYKTLDIATPVKCEDESVAKPWDLRCSRKRKADDDIDEGISCHEDQNKSSSSTNSANPTPAKVVKLFKPYLMSSDDEDDSSDSGKKCSTSDNPHKDSIIWSSHSNFYDNTASQQQSATITTFHHSPVNAYSTPADVQQPSYWLNHGSPVSGYDSASSTFSDCNCNDSTCQTKLSSPAPTVSSSFSDDFSTSPSRNSTTDNHADSVTATVQPSLSSTKYMIPRRHILEKWSHEDDIIAR